MDDNEFKKNNIKEKFRVLTETSPDCIKLFDTNGKLLYINPGGLKEHNLKSLEDALDKDWQAIETLIETDKLKFKKAFEDALEDKISTIEIEHTKDGSIRDFCLETIAPVKDNGGNIVGVFGVSRDITELKKIQNDLNETKQNLEEKVKERTEELFVYEQMVKNMSEGVYIVGLDDVIIKYTNPKFEKMFGYGPNEMLGKHASIVNASADKDPKKTAEEIMDTIHKTGEWHGEIENIKKDGTPFWCYANVSTFSHSKFGDVLIAVHSDISERKKIEQKLNEKLEQLEKTNNVMVGRELEMVNLKKKMKELEDIINKK